MVRRAAGPVGVPAARGRGVAGGVTVLPGPVCDGPPGRRNAIPRRAVPLAPTPQVQSDITRYASVPGGVITSQVGPLERLSRRSRVSSGQRYLVAQATMYASYA